MSIFRKKEPAKQISANEILVGTKQITFSHPIREYKIIERKVFVTLNITNELLASNNSPDILRNVYCFNVDGELLWQIEPTLCPDDPYLGVEYCTIAGSNGVKAFAHVRYDLDTETGAVSNPLQVM